MSPEHWTGVARLSASLSPLSLLGVSVYSTVSGLSESKRGRATETETEDLVCEVSKADKVLYLESTFAHFQDTKLVKHHDQVIQSLLLKMSFKWGGIKK